MSLWQKLRRAVPYHAHFLASSRHGWLALVTLGVGIAVASPISVVAGVAAYGLGVIFLPELGIFRKDYDAIRHREFETLRQQEIAAKEKVRASLFRKLALPQKQRWEKFSSLCDTLRAKMGDSETDRLLEQDFLTKVADSHLLLLAMDADIRDYLKTSEPADTLEQRTAAIEAELAKLHARPSLNDVEQRLTLSKEETLKNLRQEAEQSRRMEANLELAQSELQRLESQISFLRAELISNPAGQLSNRLGDTLVQVEASQRVLQEGGMVTTPDLTTLLGERA